MWARHQEPGGSGEVNLFPFPRPAYRRAYNYDRYLVLIPIPPFLNERGAYTQPISPQLNSLAMGKIDFSSSRTYQGRRGCCVDDSREGCKRACDSGPLTRRGCGGGRAREGWCVVRGGGCGRMGGGEDPYAHPAPKDACLRRN